MEAKKRGICTTCHYERNCSIKTTTGSSWECSEYLTSKIFSSGDSTYYSSAAQSVKAGEIKGLCASCGSVASCQWLQPGTVIFHCEHYQ